MRTYSLQEGLSNALSETAWNVDADQGHYIWSDGSEYFGEFHEAETCKSEMQWCHDVADVQVGVKTEVLPPKQQLLQRAGLHVGQWQEDLAHRP